jgi:hypothetical protein
MIEKLTKEQKAKTQDYVEKWLKIALSTENPTKERTEEIINNIYEKLLLEEKPKKIKIFEDPIECWKKVSKYAFKKYESQVWNQVRSQVGSQVGSQVWNQVEGQVESQVRSEVRSQIRSQVESEVRNQVRSEVRSEVRREVRSEVRSQKLLNFVYPYFDGNLMSSYFSFYDYFIDEGIIQLDEKISNMWDIYKSTSELELIYPFDDICFICQKPTIIKLQNNILHNESGPSISYNDNFKIYSLNGITVAEEIVMTKAEDIDLNKYILQEKNADVRREVVRKVGIERVLKELNAKVIDKSEDGIYELVLLDIHNTKKPYLKMKNPSIDLIHIEGVPIECDTVEKALAWRDGEDVYIKPDVMS